MEWFAHIDGCCWRSGIIWRQTCPQLAALQLVHEFICTAWQVQKKLVKITLTCNCAVMLLAQLIMWLAHDFWLHIILCKQQLFNFYLSVTCTAGKQAWNAVPSHLPFYSVAGMMELCFFHCMFHPSHSVVGIPSKPCSSSLLRKFNPFLTIIGTVRFLICSGMHMHLNQCQWRTIKACRVIIQNVCKWQ